MFECFNIKIFATASRKSIPDTDGFIEGQIESAREQSAVP